jgi:hypothetical protein
MDSTLSESLISCSTDLLDIGLVYNPTSMSISLSLLDLSGVAWSMAILPTMEARASTLMPGGMVMPGKAPDNESMLKGLDTAMPCANMGTWGTLKEGPESRLGCLESRLKSLKLEVWRQC